MALLTMGSASPLSLLPLVVSPSVGLMLVPLGMGWIVCCALLAGVILMLFLAVLYQGPGVPVNALGPASEQSNTQWPGFLHQKQIIGACVGPGFPGAVVEGVAGIGSDGRDVGRGRTGWSVGL